MKKMFSFLIAFILFLSCAELSGYGYVVHEVAVGKTLTLTRTTSVQNVYSVVWTSDSTAVSIETQGISSCKIKGVREESSVTIKADIYYYIYSGTYTYANSTNEAFVVNVTKAQDTTVSPTSISLPSSLSLSVGESSTLSPSILPSNATKTCTWSTSNASVATVSSGRVTGVKSGTAIVKAKTSNGLSASCTVSVSDIPLSLSSSSPKSGDENADVGQPVTLTFNTNIYEHTNFGKIKLTDNTSGDIASGTASISGKTLVYTPSDTLSPGHSYTFSVPKNALKNSEDNGNSSDVTLSFRAEALLLAACTPLHNSKNVGSDIGITLTFNSSLQKGTKFESIGLLSNDGTCVTLKKSISDNKLLPAPTSLLMYNMSYTLTVPQDALKNADGYSHKKEITLSFTTEASPLKLISSTPENSATDVLCDAEITLDFNDSIASQSALSKAYFLNRTDKSSVSAHGIVNGSSVTFYSDDTLDVMTKYYFVVPAGAITSANGITNQETRLEFTTAPFQHGDGTKSNPYQINTTDELFAFASSSSKFEGEYLELKRDIVLNKDRAWKPKSQFYGTFDGGGHTISGLYYNGSSSHGENIGFIGSAISATIKNLSLEDIDMSFTQTGSDYYCNQGGLIGYASSTEISRCSVTGEIYSYTSKDSGMRIGGLVGYYYRSYNYLPIQSCYNGANITVERTCGRYSSIPDICASGLVGFNEYATTTNGGLYIYRSFNCGTVTIKDNSVSFSCAGGVVGEAEHCELTGCYNVGALNIESNATSAYTGAIIAYVSARYKNITKTWDCYSSSDCGTGTAGIQGTSVSLDSMRQQETFQNWNFVTAWVIDPTYNDGFPIQRNFIRPRIGALDVTKSSALITVNITTRNLPSNAVVYIASYRKDGRLLELKEISPDSNSAEFTRSVRSVAYLRAFAWDKQTLKPLTDSYAERDV